MYITILSERSVIPPKRDNLVINVSMQVMIICLTFRRLQKGTTAISDIHDHNHVSPSHPSSVSLYFCEIIFTVHIYVSFIVYVCAIFM